MVQITPFSGWRYDLCQVGALSVVTTPPLDAVDEKLQRELYQKHPCNVIRLVMNREEPGDLSSADRVARADDFLRVWRREGILLREHDQALYVVQSEFLVDQTPRTRWSLIARMRLPETIETCSIPAHVAKDSVSVSGKVELLRSCQTDVVPVTVLTGSNDLDADVLSDILEKTVRQKTPIEIVGDDGRLHRMWPVTDKSAQVAIEGSVASVQGLVIDGVDEFLAALLYRDMLVSRGQLSDPNHPAQSVLAWIVPADDAGSVLSPVLHPVAVAAQFSVRDFINSQNDGLSIQYVGNEPAACEDAVELAALNEQQPCLAFGSSDGHWCIVAARDASTDHQHLHRHLVQAVSSATVHADPGEHAKKSGRSVERLAETVQKLFRSTSAGALIIHPAMRSEELLLEASSTGVPVSCYSGQVAILAPLPIGLVFAPHH